MVDRAPGSDDTWPDRRRVGVRGGDQSPRCGRSERDRILVRARDRDALDAEAIDELAWRHAARDRKGGKLDIPSRSSKRHRINTHHPS